jgi:hypothetical protein
LHSVELVETAGLGCFLARLAATGDTIGDNNEPLPIPPSSLKRV